MKALEFEKYWDCISHTKKYKFNKLNRVFPRDFSLLHVTVFGVLFLFNLFTASHSLSQEKTRTDTTQKQLLKGAKEIIEAAGTCALITLDEEGLARVRTMDPFPPEKDFTVWLGTNRNSRKVNQIKKDPRVSLYYLDSDASGYVIIKGSAELVDTKVEKEKWWKKEWEAFYTDKDKDYLLIKVIPEWIEISSTPRGIFSDPVTWQAPRVVFRSE